MTQAGRVFRDARVLGPPVLRTGRDKWTDSRSRRHKPDASGSCVKLPSKRAAWGIRTLAGLAFAISLQNGAAWACTPLPNTLTNGATADATQVMADFNGILSCPLVTGSVGIDTATPAVLLDITGSSATASAGT